MQKPTHRDSARHVALLLVLTLALPAIGRSDVLSSTFDSDDEGWRLVGDASSSVPGHSAVDGNPGGMIFFNDSVLAGVVYFDAPAKFLGDQSRHLGTLLSFDLRQTGSGSQFSSRDVILIGNGEEINYKDFVNPPVGVWTSFSVALDDSEAWEDTSNNPVNNTQILNVLSNLTALQIRGEFITGPDTGRLDNVSLGATTSPVPEPSSLILFAGAGLIGFAIQRRRRQKTTSNPSGNGHTIHEVSKELPEHGV